MRFMASKPPMLICIAPHTYKERLYMKDFEGRGFYTIIPQLVGRECVGLSCGYLILFGQETRDFWLVNPIITHELHFPNITFDVGHVKGVLVFSRAINGWVFVMANRGKRQIWFSIEGTGAWNHVSSTNLIFDLHAFKGKIYTLNLCCRKAAGRRVCEMRLTPVPKITEIDMHFVNSALRVFDFVSSDEKLYLMESMLKETYKVYKLEFERMSWVHCEKTRQEYAVFYSCSKFSAAIKPESWAAPSSQYVKLFHHRKHGKNRFYNANMWYFPMIV